MPSSGLAPGADDNASGSVATLLAADILTQYRWSCTLRFAFWTGEEQGLLGSAAYAQRSYSEGENILGYLNLDMIGWNTIGSSPDIDLHADQSGVPASMQLAQLFADVVDAYNLSLIPQINPNGTGASDHASFWDYGYTSILGIEDFGDFNPRYHTSDDKLQYLDMDYYTDFVKASIATFAHMSGCLIPSGIGYLDGTVTAAGSGAPLANATVTAIDPLGQPLPVTPDASGYYTQLLVADTYTVTAEAYGYEPMTVTQVVVAADAVTTQDFALQPITAILATPPTLGAVLRPGQSATQTLWLSNTRDTELVFTFHEGSHTAVPGKGLDELKVLSQPADGVAFDLPWLAEEPVSGTLPAGGGRPITITFDAGSLAPGAYLGLLDLESNDPIAPHTGIAVTLTVELCGSVEMCVYLPIVVGVEP
jgi:hypothetical protein